MRRRDVIAMLAIVAIGCALTIAFGERIGVNHGEGWDGQAYAEWARDLPHAVFDVGVTPYQSQRVLPSAIVYASHAGAILGFQLLDALALLVAVALLARIASTLRWSRSAAWAAFVGMVASFALARQALYYPTLTDPTALALGMAMVWAFLERRPIAQAVIALASVVTWPVLFVLGVAALVLPRPAEELPAAAARWHRFAAIGVGLATAAFVTAWLVEQLVHGYAGTERWIAAAHHELYPITIACAAISSAAAAYLVARDDRTWSVVAYVRGVGAKRFALGVATAAAIVIARRVWIAQISHGESPEIIDMQHMYAAMAVCGPAWNLVHHVVYFGPIVIVALGAWRRLAGIAAAWGPWAIFVIATTIVIAVNTESRQLTHAFPFFVVAAIAATADRWTPRCVIAFAALCLPWSKLWLPIHYNVPSDPSAWPDLRYTMQHGPWASDATYLAHFAAAIVTAVALWFLLRPGAQPAR